MSSNLDTALAAWPAVAPLLDEPKTEADYERLTETMDRLLAMTDLTNQPEYERLLVLVSDMVEAYEAEHYPMPAADGTKLLKAMMKQHGLRQSEIPEIGAQSVVSAILSGKRRINVNQARALHARWPTIPFAAWLEDDGEGDDPPGRDMRATNLHAA